MHASNNTIDEMIIRIYNFAFLISTLSILFPSSSCSATSRDGSSCGIIRRGCNPGTTEYLEKSVMP